MLFLKVRVRARSTVRVRLGMRLSLVNKVALHALY